MTFPAWFELHRDPVVRRSPSALSVYAFLLGEYPDILHTPTAVKVWVIARELRCEKKTVLRSLRTLVQRHYLLEHARGFKGVRTFTIALRRPTGVPNDTHLSGPSGPARVA